ncbi:MAG: nuclear transport factor 2 family protein [Pseudomonadales bacterium]|nr:nuclear transport factor 2 family protein [Pseudomonadales bacterium]
MDTELEAQDKVIIREIVDNWAIFSDSGDWEGFARCWHDDGFMCATWFQAPCQEFIAARRKGFDNGVSIIHFHGGFNCEVAGIRAVSQTKMTISQRALVHDVLVDVVCTGRFYDFFENRRGHWGMVRRQPIYEKDRLDVVMPNARLELDPELLNSFPEGYRHLAYLQSQIGYEVKKSGLPGLKGPEVEKLYAEGRAWLQGAPSPGRP